jgi:hypothetical protein
MRQHGWHVLRIVGGVTMVLMLAWWYHRSPVATSPDTVATFLQKHWRLPIPAQGKPPQHFASVEASLHPQDCGVCHPQQYQDWQQSLHSRSIGPGIYGQLVELEQSDPASYTLCTTCHAPLSEQLPFVADDGAYRPNAAFDARLQQAGLVCAACHVRQHRRFGPPRRLDSPAPAAGTALPHDGFTATVAFQRAEFCASCHQFSPNDFALNGKLIENTYEEWRQSSYAAQGVQCQHCHMPDRRHLWRGIHDPDMVRQALTVTITPETPSYTPGSSIQVVITVANSGAGHYLPTYVTPKLFVQAHLLDTHGASIEGSAYEAVIGREVALDLSAEMYDTRIPPHAAQAFTYTQTIPEMAAILRVRVVVHPDHFYARFFAAVLQDTYGPGRPYLEAALRNAHASPFIAFARDMPLRRLGN